jgi:general secretion pathway protein C
MYSTDRGQARAIIESQAEGARSYAIREKVTDNAEIYSIEQDRVILTHAGKREALLLDPEQQTASTQPDAGNQPAKEANSDQASSQSSADVPKKTADLMREFSATPVTENGELLGFQLTALQNPEVLESWGIEPGDVITAVNGVALNAPGRVMVLYDKLRKQREFEVTLSNAGKTRTITLDLND